jgi:hypothetical protein
VQPLADDGGIPTHPPGHLHALRKSPLAKVEVRHASGTAATHTLTLASGQGDSTECCPQVCEMLPAAAAGIVPSDITLRLDIPQASGVASHTPKSNDSAARQAALANGTNPPVEIGLDTDNLVKQIRVCVENDGKGLDIGHLSGSEMVELVLHELDQEKLETDAALTQPLAEKTV